MALLTTTSGTTGIPKLVEWPTAPRVCTSKGRVDIWNLNKDDITMAIAPHAGGAAGTLTYFAAPLAGAKTVMLEEFSPEEALALIEKEKATAIGVVPTHLVRMLEVDASKYDLSSLRFIRSAGGYLSPQIAEEAEKAFGASITSDLGTQDMGSVSGCRVEDSKDLRRRTVGRMLPGNKVRLLDKETGEPVPDGEPGVLYFRGPHAPAGYYRDEELTSTVFDPERLDHHRRYRQVRPGVPVDPGTGQGHDYPRRPEYLSGRNRRPAQRSSQGGLGGRCRDTRTGKWANGRAPMSFPKAARISPSRKWSNFSKEKSWPCTSFPNAWKWSPSFPRSAIGKVNKETLKKDIAEKVERGE